MSAKSSDTNATTTTNSTTVPTMPTPTATASAAAATTTMSTDSSGDGTNNCRNNNNNNNNMSNVRHSTEQPQTKRQKIEKIKSKSLSATTTTATTICLEQPDPPDIIHTGMGSMPEPIQANGKGNKQQHQQQQLFSSSLSSSAHSISTASSSSNNSTPASTPSSSRTASLSQLLNVQNIVNIVLPPNRLLPMTATDSTQSNSSSGEQSADEVDRVAAAQLPDLVAMHPIVHPASPPTTSSSSSTTSTALPTGSLCPVRPKTLQLATTSSPTTSPEMREFEDSLTKQCLCSVPERILRKPFQSHYSLDDNGQKRIANLSEWPTPKLLQFLSNLQLLFDIYLKQNSKGFICARISDVCDALARNDYNLMDELIELSSCDNIYVQFLASRVLSSFLVIAKQELDEDWLKKLVENLFNFERLDGGAVQKIHFSLDIIRRVVEWKDLNLHPLDEEYGDSPENAGIAEESAAASTALGGDGSNAFLHFQTQRPTLENNYFAVHFRTDHEAHVDADADDNNDAEGDVDEDDYMEQRSQSFHSQQAPHSISSIENGADMMSGDGACHLVALTDSESFDTTHLKCITIKILEIKWPALVKNISTLIANHLDIQNAEHCVLNFLELWENIISVKANLSIEETLPFYAQLDKFEMLLNQNVPCTVYKQMLCLFNEALCYGSTLALQDMLPDETCRLAHQIVRHVKDFRILESLPRLQPQNVVGLIGFKRKPLVYENDSLQAHTVPHAFNPESAGGSGGELIEMDKTILQKMVLLVLKSIAVTVKEIRSDSSDSSIDSNDCDAYQDMVLIERSIRDALQKLESFIKNTLEFHPECHFSKILIHLFDDQDDHLIEAMVCTLDVTAGISFRNNAFPELVSMLNPVYTFLEFLKMISNSSDLLLDLLVSNETCFLLYLLRFLKYIRMNWTMFVQSCHDFGMGSSAIDEAMGVLIRLRLQISRLVSRQLYPYDISPVLRLLESCESLYEGNELA